MKATTIKAMGTVKNLTKRIERIIQGKLIQREQGERNLTKRIESDMDKRLRVGEAERLESHKEN